MVDTQSESRTVRPVIANRGDYDRKFKDVVFWHPYIQEVVRRHGLPDGIVSTGRGGTFPTFLVGAHVVKFFPKRFDGGACFQVERSLHTRVLNHLDVPAPRHVADGHLFQTGWRWPYLVTTRIEGTPWRHARAPLRSQQGVASLLGTAMRRVHDHACPDEPIWRHDLIAELRATCAERHRRRGILPRRLVDQIDSYLAPRCGTSGPSLPNVRTIIAQRPGIIAQTPRRPISGRPRLDLAGAA